MKKLILTATLTLACVAAFAQGKVNFQNNSLHLVYYTTDHNSLIDPTNAGAAYLLGSSSQVLTIELWAGTSSTALSLQGTTSFTGQASAGTWAGRTLIMPSVPGGASFFNIEIYDAAAGSYQVASTTLNHYYGATGVFSANASSGTAYFSLVQHISPAFSTWADGTYNLDTVSTGFRGAIMLAANVPEPSTFALAGLGAAAMLIFRRRK